MCNSLSKHTAARAIISGTRREETQLLPGEDETVFVNNKKLSDDSEKKLCSAKLTRNKTAAIPYPTKVGWVNSATRRSKTYCTAHWGKNPDGYTTWLTKQHMIGCETRVRVGYYSGNSNGNVSFLKYGGKEQQLVGACVTMKTG
jgi:hypothetical protein